jgi:ABC-2 type transport system ATP-binding protein
MSVPVKISALCKSFGTQNVLNDLNWIIQPGSIVGLLGRNGAGKSSLLECMLGLRDYQAGEITLFGEDNTALSAVSKAKIGYVPQTSDVFEWLTATQMFSYFRALYPCWNDTKVNDLMRRWELPFDKVISQLSVGQKQRLSIIRALAHEPELLVLDEPVSSLDPAGRRDFLHELVDSVIGQQTTIIFSTHILSDLERIAMDVAFLQGGRIAHQQALDDMMDNTVSVTGASSEIGLLMPSKILRTESTRDGNSKMLAQFDTAQMRQLETQNNLRVEKLGLEDLFIEMTR